MTLIAFLLGAGFVLAALGLYRCRRVLVERQRAARRKPTTFYDWQRDSGYATASGVAS